VEQVEEVPMRSRHDAAFDEFATTELPRARRAAYLMCGDWAEAEDLAQQALVRLYRAWPRLERDRSLHGWMTTTLTRLWIDEVRRRGRRPVVLVAEPPDRPTDVDTDGSERDHLLAVLATLPPRQRACLVLRFWEDLSVAETARALGCSDGTVKSLTHHGVRAMRDRLDLERLEERS
jgi:RNA polymerase sigma-70 factor (sigma-E family)